MRGGTSSARPARAAAGAASGRFPKSNYDQDAAATDTQATDLREAASILGLKLVFLQAGNEQEIDAAFATLVQQRIGALLLTDVTFFNGRREQLVTLARFNAIPTMYTFRE